MPAPKDDISAALLRQMIALNDEKHDNAHDRLRKDCEEGMNNLSSQLDWLRGRQDETHNEVQGLKDTRERRKEISGAKAVVLAAAVAGSLHLLEVIVQAAAALLK